MKRLYLDCSMGAAGDMLAAALAELLSDKNAFIEKFNSLGIPGLNVRLDKSMKCGILGSHFTVDCFGTEEDEHLQDSNHHSHGHSHGSMSHIEEIVDKLRLSDKVKDDILSVYYLLAQAESAVHGVSVADIHFHEVGTMDALADISAVCMIIDEIKPDVITASAVNVGSGTVKCAHGILPVPAPATAWLLKDVPIYSSDINSELCTPTGAALLKYFVREFTGLPQMTLKNTGYGMGKKDFPRANCLRAMLGESADRTDSICQLSCNVDDMTGEAIGFALETIMEAGALDVFTVPIGMKKSRPATLISVLCREDEAEKYASLIFRHTNTIGIRKSIMQRYTLEREIMHKESPCGPVKIKISKGYGVCREKVEYEDVSRIAREKGISLNEVLEMLDM